MKQFLREYEAHIFGFLLLYISFSFILWGIRALERDCKNRYVDYLFPLSFFHCEIKTEAK